MPENRTSEHTFSYITSFKKRHKNGERMFAYFIGKAFDIIPRNELHHQLLAHGINRNFL